MSKKSRRWFHNVVRRGPAAARRLIVLAVAAAVGWASIGVLNATAAFSSSTTPSPEPGQPGSTTPIVNVDGNQALWFIGIVAGAVALLWFSLLFFDLRATNKWRQEHQRPLIDKMIDGARDKREGLSIDEVRQLVSAMDKPPRGSTGLTRSLLALTIVTLVGVALVATLVSTGGDAIDQRKTIVTSLLSITATITGFYFGSRTAQTSSEEASTPPDAPSSGADGATGAAGAVGPVGPAGVAGAGAVVEETVEGPVVEEDEPEPELLPNPEGDDEGQVQDDDSEPLPDAPERDHR